MTTVLIMAMDGATTIVTIGDGIQAGTIGVIAFGSRTITIHGTIHIVTTDVIIMATTITATLIMDTIITDHVTIHTLTDREGHGLETQA